MDEDTRQLRRKLAELAALDSLIAAEERAQQAQRMQRMFEESQARRRTSIRQLRLQLSHLDAACASKAGSASPSNVAPADGFAPQLQHSGTQRNVVVESSSSFRRLRAQHRSRRLLNLTVVYHGQFGRESLPVASRPTFDWLRPIVLRIIDQSLRTGHLLALIKHRAVADETTGTASQQQALAELVFLGLLDSEIEYLCHGVYDFLRQHQKSSQQLARNVILSSSMNDLDAKRLGRFWRLYDTYTAKPESTQQLPPLALRLVLAANPILSEPVPHAPSITLATLSTMSSLVYRAPYMKLQIGANFTTMSSTVPKALSKGIRSTSSIQNGMIVAIGEGGDLVIQQPSGARCITRRPPGVSDEILSATLSEDMNLVLLGTSQRYYVHNRAGDRVCATVPTRLQSVDGPTQVLCAAFLPVFTALGSQNVFGLGLADGIVVAFDISDFEGSNNPRPRAKLQYHVSPVQLLDALPGTQRIVSMDCEAIICIWRYHPSKETIFGWHEPLRVFKMVVGELDWEPQLHTSPRVEVDALTWKKMDSKQAKVMREGLAKRLANEQMQLDQASDAGAKSVTQRLIPRNQLGNKDVDITFAQLNQQGTLLSLSQQSHRARVRRPQSVVRLTYRPWTGEIAALCLYERGISRPASVGVHLVSARSQLSTCSVSADIDDVSFRRIALMCEAQGTPATAVCFSGFIEEIGSDVVFIKILTTIRAFHLETGLELSMPKLPPVHTESSLSMLGNELCLRTAAGAWKTFRFSWPTFNCLTSTRRFTQFHPGASFCEALVRGLIVQRALKKVKIVTEFTSSSAPS